MRIVVLPVVLLCISVTSLAEPQTRTVPLEYPTITAAVAAAAPGDIVLIKPGQYMETLSIDKPITLKGENAEQVRIYSSVMAGALITVTSQDTVYLENLIFEHSDQEQESNERKYPDLALIKGGKAEALHCVFRKGAGCGVVVCAGAQAVVRECRAEDNVQAGFLVKDERSVSKFDKNTATRNGWAGLVARDGASAEIVENDVQENGTYGGIYVSNGLSGAMVIRGNRSEKNRDSGINVGGTKDVILESNTCLSNDKHGIDIDTGAIVTARQNRCEGNRNAGIYIAGIFTRGILEENTASKNMRFGIYVNHGGSGEIRNNTVSENERRGIFVSNWETTAEVQGNTCSNNKKDGIAISQGAKARVAGNICTGNAEYGVIATDEGTAAEIGSNTLDANGKTPDIPAISTPLSRQNQEDGYYVGWALFAGEFDYLDRLAAGLRENKCRNSKGEWELFQFYEDIETKYSALTRWQKDKYKAQVEAWIAKKPDSATARIVLARMYTEFAWDCRGSGTVDTVTDEGYKGFKQYLREAERVIQEAESLNAKDPELYRAWLTIGLGLGYKYAQEFDILKKGVDCDSGYYPLYSSMAHYLRPRWHGSVKELQAFCEEARKMSADSLGDSGYALLITYVLSEFNFHYLATGKMADWTAVEGGYRQLLQEFEGSSNYLNSFCFTACCLNKREVAAELFEKIGNHPDKSFWNKEEGRSYYEFQRWATMEGVPHPWDDGSGSSEQGDPLFRSVFTLRALLFIGGVMFTLFSIVVAILVVVLTRRNSPPPPPLLR